MLHRLLSPVPLATVLLLTAATPSSAILTRGTLDKCVVTWDSFCPVESIGLSLLGTMALAIVTLAGWFMFAKLSDSAERSGLGGIATILRLAARFPLHALALVAGGIFLLLGS